ncbi:type II toxin-antitoxin system RelE/ParE family toxin [Rhodoferax sp.]|uniref:type II toxin-antitoxin system RelE/ParE family toxin n=1 Tax=Rhodoferax sp. TaxID=50421 RepID=UPI002631FCDB|nr:type II toxin-antitoxin system RelE/ParE family toxin [Rhodoferax sp.]MDD5479262.1 type II toxin-antitoxin system RelE/ParE family toxin [Rhodoferax sp.]
MRLEFLPQAEQDMETIGDYIALDNPRRAASFVRDLQVQCRKLAKAPQAYRPRLELGKGIRSCTHGHYVVLFYEEPDLNF